MSCYMKRYTGRCVHGCVNGRVGCAVDYGADRRMGRMGHVNMVGEVFRACADSVMPVWKEKAYGAYGNA